MKITPKELRDLISDNGASVLELEESIFQAASRIEELESELERLMDVVGEEDFKIISDLLDGR